MFSSAIDRPVWTVASLLLNVIVCHEWLVCYIISNYALSVDAFVLLFRWIYCLRFYFWWYQVFMHYSSVHSVRSISVLFVHLMFGSTCMTCSMQSSKPISNIMFIDIVLDLGSEATCFFTCCGIFTANLQHGHTCICHTFSILLPCEILKSEISNNPKTLL